MFIRKANRHDAPLLTRIIRDSFRDVAERFLLNEENCPRHPSNCTVERLERHMDRGASYFVLEVEGEACGCVAMEHPKPGLCYLERLAVLPRYRGQGHGTALVRHVLAEVRAQAEHRVQIGIIAAHTELQEWYERRGFHVTGRGEFEHLPFAVTFMAAEA